MQNKPAVSLTILDDHGLLVDSLSSWFTGNAPDFSVAVAETSWAGCLANGAFPSDVVLMDYRDHAYGPDGILSHAQDELAYARKIGKRVMLGVWSFLRQFMYTKFIVVTVGTGKSADVTGTSTGVTS